jgi:hypothetical protein
MLREEGSTARTGALNAGAAHVLLSALETHKLNAEVCGTVMKVLLSTVATDPAVLSAAKELGSCSILLTVVDVAGRVIASAGGAAKAQAPAADGSAKAAVNTIATLDAEKALILVRQILLCLSSWAADAALASKMCSQASQVILGLLTPPSAKNINSVKKSLYTDAPLLEACLAVLAPIASTSTSCAESLVRKGEGDIMRLLSPLPCMGHAMDRQALVEHTLTLLQAAAGASSACAWHAVQANGHGVCQGIAVHWAVKRASEEATRRALYERAGQVLAALMDKATAARTAAALASPLLCERVG